MSPDRPHSDDSSRQNPPANNMEDTQEAPAVQPPSMSDTQEAPAVQAPAQDMGDTMAAPAVQPPQTPAQDMGDTMAAPAVQPPQTMGDTMESPTVQAESMSDTQEAPAVQAPAQDMGDTMAAPAVQVEKRGPGEETVSGRPKPQQPSLDKTQKSIPKPSQTSRPTPSNPVEKANTVEIPTIDRDLQGKPKAAPSPPIVKKEKPVDPRPLLATYRIWVIATGSALLVNLVVGFFIYMINISAGDGFDGPDAVSEIVTASQIIRQQYVDTDKTSYRDLKDGAINGMLDRLDPFSRYYPNEQSQEVEEQIQGEFGGIGVIIGVQNHILTVIEPVTDGPSERAGVEAGDEILGVDGKLFASDVTQDDAIRQIKGKPGTKVTIKFRRPSDNDRIFDVELIRETIAIPSVTDATWWRPGIVYVRITQFNGHTGEELERMLADYAQKSIDGVEGIKGIVLDLRFNPGGLIHEAVRVCSLFLTPHDDLVVYTQGRDEEDKRYHYAVEGPKYYNIPVAILINSNSASASEIVASCLRDSGVATLIGEKSFGKGIVQEPFSLPNGSIMYLSTAYYYTLKEQVIHGKGVEPDIIVNTEDDSSHSFYRKRLSPTGADPGINPVTSDVQLLKALDVLRDKINSQ